MKLQMVCIIIAILANQFAASPSITAQVTTETAKGIVNQNDANSTQDKEIEIRRAAHAFLFEEYLSDKKCVYSDDGSVLKEVIISSKEWTVEKDETVDLPEGTERILGFFTNIVLKGDKLDQDLYLSLEPYYPIRKMIQDFRSVDRSEFRIREFPASLPDLEYLQLRLRTPQKAVVKEIALSTNHEVPKKFDPQTAIFFGAMSRAEYVDFAFRITTMNQSFEELATSLNQNSDAFALLVCSAALTPRAEPPVYMNSVIADRRVAKLYESLAKMEPEIASAKALENFDREFLIYQTKYGLPGTLLPAMYAHAVYSNLFLCSEFCSPEIVAERIGKWENLVESSKISAHGAPSGLLIANIYANMIVKKQGLTLDAANALFKVKMFPIINDTFPELKGNTLFASDWTPAKADPLTVVPVFETWGGSTLGQNKVADKLILERLRQLLE